MGVDSQCVHSRGNGPGFAVTSTRVRRDVEFHAVRDADLTGVTCNEATDTISAHSTKPMK